MNVDQAMDGMGTDLNGPEAIMHETEENGKSWRGAMNAARVKGMVKDEAAVETLKSEKAAQPKESMVSIIELYSFSDRLDHLLMFLGTLGAAGHGVSTPILLYFYSAILDGIVSSMDPERSTRMYALIFMWVSFGAFVSTWVEIAFWMHTGQRQAAKLRTRYLEALLRQDVAYFDMETNTGDVVTSIATDTLTVQCAISEKTGHFVQHMTTFVASLLIGLAVEWRVSVVTLALVPCIAIPGGLYTYLITRCTRKASAAYSDAGNIVQQAVSQIRTVHSFVIEEKFVQTYADALRKTLKLGIYGGMVKGMGVGTIMAVSMFGYAVLLSYGGILVRNHQASGGVVFATIFNVVVGTTSLAQALANFTPFCEARASAFKILQVIRQNPSINSPAPDAQAPKTVLGHIELRNVDFCYPSRPEAPVFQNFSLVVAPGKSVAIVGSSGSGKSTVISLIERFYDPTAGKVLLDGIDLKSLDLNWLRRQIGLVNQEPALFATSIAANIAYGSDRNASDAEIEAAAMVANAHSFIKQLSLGYQSQVGERGVQLSGGQRQRIAIARAIIRNPTVLLLDEATSALDARSELAVQEAIEAIMHGRTTVIVAHRLSTIRNADRIAVVERGRIVESGTHQELMSAADGAYSTLVHLQELGMSTYDGPSHPEGPASVQSPLRLRGESPRQSPSSVTSPVRLEAMSFPSRHEVARRKNSPSGEVTDETSDEPKKQREKSKVSLKRLVAMTREDWKYGVAAVFGSVGAGWISPLLALFVSSSITAFFTADNVRMRNEITKFSLLFVALGFWAIFVCNIQHYSVGVVGERLTNRIRKKIFAKILRNEVGWFDEADNNSSQLVARLASDAATVRTVLGDRSSVLLQNLTNTLLTFSIAFYLQWRMAVVMGVVFPLLVCANGFEQTFLVRAVRTQNKAYERATRLAGEALGNIRTVAAFNLKEKVQALFTKELEGLSSHSFRSWHMVGLLYGFCVLFSINSNALGLWYGSKLVATGEFNLAAVFKPYFLIIVCTYAIGEALATAPDLGKGGQAVASLFRAMDRVTKIDTDNPDGEKMDKIRGDIELQQVTMVYPSSPDVIVLREVNLAVSAGQTLAIVGGSGSGKSSIIALIERFYDPISGQILIDGKDIKLYSLRALRQHIALVQQEPALFATTVYENIANGKAGASAAEVIEAAKVANAHNFISSLPEGYQTMVGDRGVQLSGGQRQRVAIARAVVRDPTILLLDEATSALDAESEKVVQEATERLMKARTTVIVAHRLSTIQGADSIAVMKDGSIVEQGTHTDLLRKGGTYYHLFRLQGQAHR